MKKHGFSHTDVEFHGDGSATVHHVHATDPKKDVKHAVLDLDGLHDSFQRHLNPESAEKEVEASGKDPEQLEEQIHPGIHDQIVEAARGEK